MDIVFWLNVVTTAIVVIIWCGCGLLLSGYIYGPFFKKCNGDIAWLRAHKIRGKCIATGIIGPLFVAINLAYLYADWGDEPKKLYWKSVF